MTQTYAYVVLLYIVALTNNQTSSYSLRNAFPRRLQLSYQGGDMALRAGTPETSAQTNLQGFESFVRSNLQSDKISATMFHHVEFYCGDATNTYKRFMMGLGMELVAKSDQSTGNTVHASYVLRSGQMQMIFTAPYSSSTGKTSSSADGGVTAKETCKAVPFPNFHGESAFQFFCKHGLGIKAIAIEVDDVAASYQALIQNGAVSCLQPAKVYPGTDADNALGWAEYAEVSFYGDVVLRLINSKNYRGAFLPHFVEKLGTVPTTPTATQGAKDPTYGLFRYDHIVGNVWELGPTMERVKKMTVSD